MSDIYKNEKKAALFCSHGLGDGLIFLTLANNLVKNGWDIIVYHPFLHQLEEFLPCKTAIFPTEKSIACEDGILKHFDLILINVDGSSINKFLVQEARDHFLEKSFFFKPTTCKKISQASFSKRDIFLNTNISLTENLGSFCKDVLNLKDVVNDNGFQINAKEKLLFKKHKKRVVFHPSSKDKKRNFPLSKFLKLAFFLKKDGYQIVFMTAPFERDNFLNVLPFFEIPKFSSLKEMAFFIYESSFFIGNDSGLSHMAASLNIPTLSIFTTHRKEIFWKPYCTFVKTIAPSKWIPNFKFFRMRDHFWYSFINVKRAYKKFLKLVKDAEMCSF